ncbi:MAG: MJ0042-type zinc finger domain-containing protein [Akkermansiaceae bacterium]
MTVRIQCPACQRQFKVSEELKGRTVECGACEKQFEVSEKAIVPDRERYFPGDIKRPGLDHYGRAPMSGETGQGQAPVQFATANYNQTASAAEITPSSPQRMVASGLGVLIQIFFIVILVFGSQQNGAFSDMEHDKRIILGGFVAFVGIALIFYGGFHRRKQAALTGVVLAGLVTGLAIFLPVPKVIESSDLSNELVARPLVSAPPEKMTEQEARIEMGYDPVEKAIKIFSAESVVALWAPTMKQRFRYQIQRYLQRKTGVGARPSFYIRGDGGLIVLEGTELDIPQIEALIQRFGVVEDVYSNLRVIRISIDGERLLEPSAELERKLNDKSHPAFYAHNQAELDHIDIDRVRDAAQRLGGVEPKMFRSEISKRLVELLEEDDDTNYRSTICNAILVWSQPNDGAEPAVAMVARELLDTKKEVPRSMIKFLLDRKFPEAIALIEILWHEDPSTWEPLLIDAGSDVERVMASYLKDKNVSVARSALLILRRVGSAASLPALREALAVASEGSERTLLINNAIQAIESGGD